jgi:hypothetical protein
MLYRAREYRKLELDWSIVTKNQRILDELERLTAMNTCELKCCCGWVGGWVGADGEGSVYLGVEVGGGGSVFFCGWMSKGRV